MAVPPTMLAMLMYRSPAALPVPWLPPVWSITIPMGLVA
jgi:hypothetical protein